MTLRSRLTARRLAAPFLALALGLTGLVAPAAEAQGTIDRDHVPSDLRVDLFERRQSDIDGNQVRTSVFNFGQTGRTTATPDEIPYEWPKNTGREYIALTGLFVGAEVVLETGERQAIFEVPNYRRSPDGQSWNFAPIQGFVNPASEDLGMARSDRPETWPAFWPDKLEDENDPGWAGSWSGYFGKDVFNADQELYYKMGDDQYDKFAYYPDSTDRSRRGLGLLIDTRVLAWSQILIEDAVFILHSVKNDGTQDLDRVGVSLWVADLVGGDADAPDDRPEFDLLLDVAFLKDNDGRSAEEAFGTVPVEAAFALFLETPGNAVDRIDNDGDGTTGDDIGDLTQYGVSVGEPGGPVLIEALLDDECPVQVQDNRPPPETCYDGIDNNGNGLVDETQAYISGVVAGLDQRGVGFADYIDNDGDGEPGSPVVTQAMIDLAQSDRWGRWPVGADLGDDPVHLVGLGRLYSGTGQGAPLDTDDLGKAFRDGIDNDEDGLRDDDDAPEDYLWEPGSPTVTQEMIDAAASDAPYYRYRVPGTDIVLYDVRSGDFGLPYADGVDNDNDGAVDEGIDEGIDEMIDERRDDGIDNDGDWRVALDDVGLDGAADSGDFGQGEGDGLPTSGAGTDLPGEANIDATDVSESDQIGITNVRSVPAGAFGEFPNDGALFQRYMIPGQFALATGTGNADTDLVVSSGLFPLRAGQTERVSFAVVFGDVDYPITGPETYRDLLENRRNAEEAYAADYRFAQAPLCPTVTAVPRDGAVTLYWDRVAEDSFDSFIADLDGEGLNPRDFEGYKVYRATDPAFLDARQITDGFGNITFLRPIAQFDLIDGIGGFQEVAVNGIQYYLGSDTRDAGEASNGLTHTYTDTTAVNGVDYFYAVTSYDFGAPSADIPPTECSIVIATGPDGEVQRLGPNVVQVTPTRAAAGYVEETGGTAEQVQGFSTASVTYDVVDPTAIKDGALYRVVFEDTLILRDGGPDTLRTESFSLLDVTGGVASADTILRRSTAFREGEEAQIVDGFRLSIDLFPDLDPNPVPGAPGAPAFVAPVDSLTGWEDEAIYDFTVDPYNENANIEGLRSPFDYQIEVVAPGAGDVSYPYEFTFFGIPVTYPSRPTNVRLTKTVVGPDGSSVQQPVRFAVQDLVGDTDETAPFAFEAEPFPGVGETDFLILFEDIENGGPCADDSESCIPTWQFGMSIQEDTVNVRRGPRAGDDAQVVTTKPWLLERDVFEFTTTAPRLDQERARDALDDVRVVPNPYVVTSGAFERQNPFSTGRGETIIQFTGVPPECTIRIFTVSGRLVRTLERRAGSNDGLTPSDLLNGVVEWDLQGEGRLAVSYGVYLYHLDAPGIGERTGTFAIVK
jgi:hypothetical protein